MVSMPSRFKRAVDGLADAVGRLFDAGELLAVRVEVEAELGGDDHPVAERRQRLADDLFILERAIDFGGVEEGHPALDRAADDGDAVLPSRACRHSRS